MASALFARPNNRAISIAAISGAMIPDCDVWLMIVVEFLRNSTGCETFHYRYLEPPWTDIQAVINSIPISVLILAIGAAIRFWGSKPVGALILVFALSALLHLCCDILLHHDDARRQFWPISDWIFRSPVSYWDPQYYGKYFVVFELFLGLSLAIILIQRFRSIIVRIAIGIGCLGYIIGITASLFEAAAHDRGPGSCEPIQHDKTMVMTRESLAKMTELDQALWQYVEYSDMFT